MNGTVIDAIERKSKEGKIFYSTLIRWTALNGQSYRADFFTQKKYEYGDIVTLDIQTMYDKTAGKERVNVRVIE